MLIRSRTDDTYIVIFPDDDKKRDLDLLREIEPGISIQDALLACLTIDVIDQCDNGHSTTAIVQRFVGTGRERQVRDCLTRLHRRGLVKRSAGHGTTEYMFNPDAPLTTEQKLRLVRLAECLCNVYTAIDMAAEMRREEEQEN